MPAVNGVDELRVYSHSVTGALNAAFEYIANAEFFGHLCNFLLVRQSIVITKFVAWWILPKNAFLF